MAKVLDRAMLTKMKHHDLIQAIAKCPRNRLIQNEFVARYKPFIRHTVSQAVYDLGKTNYSAMMRDMIDDVVNEIFYRLFRNDCRVLCGVEMQYESSIFAYLRSMCLNMVRNYVRDYFCREPLAHSRTAGWVEEDCPQSFLEQIPNEDETTHAFDIPEACTFAAEIWSKQAAFTQNLDRNLIIFKLHFIYGYHYDEIARIKGLGLGESGVGNTIARLKQRLQNETVWRKKLLH